MVNQGKQTWKIIIWYIVNNNKAFICGTRLSHIFETPNISYGKFSISNEKSIILIKNFGFRSRKLAFQFKKFKIWGFSLIESEILGISSKIPSISKTWDSDYQAVTKVTHSWVFFFPYFRTGTKRWRNAGVNSNYNITIINYIIIIILIILQMLSIIPFAQ